MPDAASPLSAAPEAPLLPRLPAALPATWTVRRPVPGDVDVVHALVSSVDRAVLGWSDWGREDVEAFLISSSAPADLSQLLVLAGDRAIAWAWAEDRAPGRVTVELAVDRTIPTNQGDLLADWGMRWLLARAAELACARERPDTVVDVGLVAGDDDHERRLLAHGFAAARTFWRMSRAVDGAATTPSSVPGVTVRPVRRDGTADPMTVHDVVEEAFADHWNHHARGFEEWWRASRESPGHDLGLWWVAELDGEPVGALLATTQMVDEDALYVATLGVRRAARGRGVARALLRAVVAEARRRGLARVALTVDGASPTGATALYRSEGMDVDFAIRVLQRPVDAG